MIRNVTGQDAKSIAEIYNYYIVNTTITFELDPITPEEILKRIEKSLKLGPYLVYEENEEVIGYCYISNFRERKAYDNTVESTIYMKNGMGGKGLGYKLYSELLSQISAKYHVIIGGISLPNISSIKLHEKCGFKKAGHFSEVGNKFGKWIDVGFWEKVGN